MFLKAAWLKDLPLMQLKRVAVDRWAQQLIIIHGIDFKRQTEGSPEFQKANYPFQ